MNNEIQTQLVLCRAHLPAFSARRPMQHGLTMIELLVAMVISLLIVLAAVAALTVTQRGFTTVDASSQLRDNLRFTSDLIQRLGVQAGFKDITEAARYIKPSDPPIAGLPTNPDPNVMGFNNALLTVSDPTGTRTARTTADGSDILILQYQNLETFPGSGISDGSMIDCSGNSSAAIPNNRYARMISVLHVAISQGEPSLMCSSTTTGIPFPTAQPIVRGVENFQVLYGVQGVTAGAAPPAVASSAPLVADESAPDRYLRADELTVAGDPVGTNANWRNVRSIRVGLVLRGPENSSQDRLTQTFYPFGTAKSSSSGTTGSAMSNTATLDPGTVFTPTVDGRLRQTASFTVHLRNDQGL
jgi:type IV pilus assembly protein PilW